MVIYKVVTQVDDRGKVLCSARGLLLGSASGLLFFTRQLETGVSLMKQNTWASTDEKVKQTGDRKAEGTSPRGTVFTVPGGIVDITGEKEEEEYSDIRKNKDKLCSISCDKR